MTRLQHVGLLAWDPQGHTSAKCADHDYTLVNGVEYESEDPTPHKSFIKDSRQIHRARDNAISEIMNDSWCCTAANVELSTGNCSVQGKLYVCRLVSSD